MSAPVPVAVIRGFYINLFNLTPDQAEIKELWLCPDGWWQPRLPSVLSGNRGNAFGEAYGKESVCGTFKISFKTVNVQFWCFFGFNTYCGANFWYIRTGEDTSHYSFTPKPFVTTHGTTAHVDIIIAPPEDNED